MENKNLTLEWPGKMTTAEAQKYLLTAGFIPVELYNAKQLKKEDQMTQLTPSQIASGAREDFYDCLRTRMTGMDTTDIDPVLTDLLAKVSEGIVNDIIRNHERGK